jgi:CheY-like chemotaxis protein
MNLVLHAAALIPDGGHLLLQTGRTEVPRQGTLSGFAFLRLTYAAIEPDPDRLFDPVGSSEDGLAMSIAHYIVAEHGGFLIARAVPEGTQLELLLPRLSEQSLLPGPAPEAGKARTVLLVDARDRVRAQLHKFFEAAGYNLLEASDRDEASALGQVHEGQVDLVIADAADRDPILSELRSKHPGLECLTMVDQPESSPEEISRPFTQQQLLERAAAMLDRRVSVNGSAG